MISQRLGHRYKCSSVFFPFKHFLFNVVFLLKDEFAKYMRLDRKINQLTEDLSRLGIVVKKNTFSDKTSKIYKCFIVMWEV